VKFEDLPDDVIQAARRRRQKDVERCGAPLGSAGSQCVIQGGALNCLLPACLGMPAPDSGVPACLPALR
jgi:hypothetical protein